MSHRLLEAYFEDGGEGLVIDATVGNGHDTVFLARLVGAGGRVLGFDLQPAAIRATRQRLDAASLGDRVALYQECHGGMGERLPRAVGAAIFNLGYLPGSGDKGLVTRAETTLAALEAVVAKLGAGGLVVVVVYPGHPGGEEEARAVENWASRLGQDEFTAISYRNLNQVNAPPYLVAIERR